LALLLKNADTEKIQLKLNRQNNTLLEKVLSLHGNLSQRIDCAIELLKRADFENIQQVLTRLSEIGGGVDQKHKVFMTWDQVRELRQTELISFGSHTVHHQILTTLEKVKIKRELWESKQNLIREQAVAPNAISFCYPNGNYSNEIKKMVQEAGYAMACTTQAGINGPNSDRFALRRVGIHQDMGAHAGLLGCRLLGLL
jgi:peptidoglycan/xylan/chitin deacetylase (PgdA/CDA1 family)